MGVADNKTYKNMYHFNDTFYRTTLEELPSLEVDPKINTSIKENPYVSNVEIEEGEIVLQPDLSALFKAKGKKHKNGGIDVSLKPDSFVFSDDKSMALTEKECEIFELGEGGKYDRDKKKKKDHNPKDYTPAKVLKKNVDIEHYNRLVSNLNDPIKDDLAKKSSAMMLEKYIGTIGNIAFAQESKKDFPTGVPEFAIGTAPVYNAELKDELEAQKQYAKYGGKIMDPEMQLGGFFGQMINDDARRTARRSRSKAGLPRATQTQPNPWGPWPGDQMSAFQDVYGISNAADKITDVSGLAQQLGYTGPKSNVDFQKWLYNSSPENRSVIEKWHNKYGDTGPIGGMFDNKIGIRWQNILRELRDRPQNPLAPADPGPRLPNTMVPRTPIANVPPPATPDNIPVPGEVTGDAQGVKRADWEFTPWQKVSQLYNLGKYAGARRYMPYRSRMNASYVDPQLLNPEQVMGDLRSGTNQQISSLNTLNPILRNAQAASTYGQFLNQAPGVRNQYDNQNVDITNRYRLANNQIRNNETQTNMQNDQQYYQQSVVGRQNYDNLKTYLGDQYMNNLMRDVETNQSLSYNLLTQNNPAYGYDWKTGNFTRNKKSILDVQGAGSQDEMKAVMDTINQIVDPYQKAQALTKLYGLKVFGPAINQQKKGGKVKYNPYK